MRYFLHFRSSTRPALSCASCPVSGDTTAPEGASERTHLILLTIALGAFLAYAAAFIYRTSFVIDGERYFSLFDDAMVSMRYARNLADGYGLVWNPGGERVEGYTNPLWVLYMAFLHVLPVASSKTSLLVQASAALCLTLNLYYVQRLALVISGGARPIAWGALVLTALYLPINFWSLEGMEVGVLTLLMTCSMLVAVRGIDTGRLQLLLYVLLAIGTLVRPDMVVAFLAFLAFMLLADASHRRRHALWGAVMLTAAVAAQTLFRRSYYGDFLPNTYYLKMTGVPFTVRIARGVYVALRFVWRASPLLFVLTGLLALRRDRRIRLLLWTFCAQVTYSVYVGGDAWEYWGGSNRYIAIAMPAFFVLLSYALYRAARILAGLCRRAPGSPPAWTAVSLIFGLGVFYALVAFNSIHGAEALAEVALLRPTLHTGEGGSNQQDVQTALLLRSATAPDASIAVFRAGTIPYFADRRAIDLLGKNDRVIAHGAVVAPGGTLGYRDFRPGHMKFDFAYSIGKLRPDVIVHIHRRTQLAKPFLAAGDYKDVLVAGRCVDARRGSPRIWWTRLPPAGCVMPEQGFEEPQPDGAAR